MLLKENKLHKGEIEAIVFCQSRNYIFVSKDDVALNYARDKNIEVISLHTLLKSLGLFGIITKDEVKHLINVMEEVDNTEIKNKEIIFE